MIVIFDLDGTLSDTSHRLHLIKQENPDWKEFYKQCINDSPKDTNIEILKVLNMMGHDIHIWSGREESVRKETLSWLNKLSIPRDALKMRPEGDYRSNDELKKEWLTEINKKDILCVFDDNQKTIDMFEKEGIPTFKVRGDDD